MRRVSRRNILFNCDVGHVASYLRAAKLVKHPDNGKKASEYLPDRQSQFVVFVYHREQLLPGQCVLFDVFCTYQQLFHADGTAVEVSAL